MRPVRTLPAFALATALGALALLAKPSPAGPAPSFVQIQPILAEYRNDQGTWVPFGGELVLIDEDKHTAEFRLQVTPGTYMEGLAFVTLNDPTYLTDVKPEFAAFLTPPTPETFAELGLTNYDYGLMAPVCIGGEQFLDEGYAPIDGGLAQDVIQFKKPQWRPSSPFGSQKQFYEPVWFRQTGNPTWTWWTEVLAHGGLSARELNLTVLFDKMLIYQAQQAGYPLPDDFLGSPDHEAMSQYDRKITIQFIGLEGPNNNSMNFPTGDTPNAPEPAGLVLVPADSKWKVSSALDVFLLSAAPTKKYSNQAQPTSPTAFTVHRGGTIYPTLVGAFDGTVARLRKDLTFQTSDLTMSWDSSDSAALTIPAGHDTGDWWLEKTFNNVLGKQEVLTGNDRFLIHILP